MSASLVQTPTTSSPRNCASSMPTTSVRAVTRARTSSPLVTFSEAIPSPECDTISFAAYRASIAGLKICTRWRAISARRKRRISSSLFPENIGPTMTSIQPILPLTMSTFAASVLVSNESRLPSLTHRASGAIHLRIVERSEGAHHRYAKSLLPGDEVAGEHAPGALCIADSRRPGKTVDGFSQLHPVFENFTGERLRHFDSAAASKESQSAIAHVSPAFQKDSPPAIFVQDVEPALEPDEVTPGLGVTPRKLNQSFGTPPCPAHQLFPAEGS